MATSPSNGRRGCVPNSVGSEDGPDLGQHRPRDVEDLQQLVVPVEPPQVHQHGAAGVGHVGEVHAAVGAAGQVPQQPAVDGAEQRLAGLGRRADAVDVGQDPLPACRRRSRWPAAVRSAPGSGRRARRRSSVADELGRPGVLPDDGVGVRLAGLPVPHDGGLPLVGDADGGEIGGAPGRARSRPAATTVCGALPDLAAGRARPSRPAAGSGGARAAPVPTSAPEWSNTMHRVLVVPWSIAATKSAMGSANHGAESTGQPVGGDAVG